MSLVPVASRPRGRADAVPAIPARRCERRRSPQPTSWSANCAEQRRFDSPGREKNGDVVPVDDGQGGPDERAGDVSALGVQESVGPHTADASGGLGEQEAVRVSSERFDLSCLERSRARLHSLDVDRRRWNRIPEHYTDGIASAGADGVEGASEVGDAGMSDARADDGIGTGSAPASPPAACSSVATTTMAS